MHWVLSGIYVIGCGFRSVLPRGDVQRLVLVDSWLSSVVVGRSVATVAELAFVTQWAVLLHEIGRATQRHAFLGIAAVIVPLIVVAEVCSWYGVLTTNYFGHVVEESLWALSAGLLLAGFVLALPRYRGPQRRFLQAGIVLGVSYALYMVCIDVPNYYAQYVAAEAAGREYLTLAEGWREVATSWTPTRQYEDWRYAMVWMSLYFSVTVWMSLFMIHAPRMDANMKNGTAQKDDAP